MRYNIHLLLIPSDNTNRVFKKESKGYMYLNDGPKITLMPSHTYFYLNVIIILSCRQSYKGSMCLAAYLSNLTPIIRDIVVIIQRWCYRILSNGNFTIDLV